MKYIERRGDSIILEIPENEVRALLGFVNEVASGPYAFSNEQWDMVMMQPREIEDKLLDDLTTVIDQFNAPTDD